jgi:DNA ligase-1
MKEIPVIPKFFDILYIDDDDLTTEPYKHRFRILEDVVRENNHLAMRKLPKSTNEATRFFSESIDSGNEGIVVKLLDSPYRPGRRGKFWFKIKRAYTIDCIILAAEWGHGRRTGWLSNLHLGVLDETRTKFLMVGKTFKGLTDKMLQWFTTNLPEHKIHEDKWTLYVKPAVVVEVAFNEVQRSPKYESDFALRFARVKRIRQDKGPYEINTILDLGKFLKMSKKSKEGR